MKSFLSLILVFTLICCNTDKRITELKTESDILNADLIGIYEYKSSEKSENHYVVIDIQNGKYDGLYFGTEDTSGHGIFFYGNKMENLKIDKKRISFEIGKRNLYETSQFKIIKHRSDIDKDSICGISRDQLKYSGEISRSGFKLKCDSEFENCWENELNFEKLDEKK